MSLKERINRLTAQIQEAPGVRRYQDLRPGGDGTFRTVTPSGTLADGPPVGVELLGAPTGMTVEKVTAWARKHAPGCAVLLRLRGDGPPVLKFLGPAVGGWESPMVLAYDCELARLFEGRETP